LPVTPRYSYVCGALPLNLVPDTLQTITAARADWYGALQISFELGKPFKPFQQLLGVLPIASRKLLPDAVASLMDTPRCVSKAL
jgi:hypothetical protein